ncbi:oxygenase MpaB family protein [Rhodococcus sp. HNM0569]|uniref:oxygenase MpaB family protein n=1 Tax=Rhodococcus sp. HNM0569 TaxID=2716340 RepID=UPI00146EF053|nr:oxygenase MpaB family protein [Rhodococcus sp. HNM0569]NLU83136.1 DUF2236 domain-containing protein [Rhodococcus sp. HNM0569]
MTCPVPRSDSTPVDATTGTRHAVEQFENFGGSVFFAMFSLGLFDQTMLPAVSAALDATGRIREQPWGRALRTAASDQLSLLGNDADRLAEAERLVRLHRDVKGVGHDGVRYSALAPESWNWILISTFFVHRGAYIALTGHTPTDAENQAVWDWFRDRLDALQLPGRSRLTADYAELARYYDDMVATKLTTTITTRDATATVLRGPRPDFVPVVAAPLWRLAAPLISRVVVVLGCGIMHPGVRALMPVPWTRRHDREFRALTALLRVAYRTLPRAVTDTPLARNRRRYRELTAKYHATGLTSFAAEAR